MDMLDWRYKTVDCGSGKDPGLTKLVGPKRLRKSWKDRAWHGAAENGTREAVNPGPWTLDPAPYTLNPKTLTLNPKP